MRSYLEAAVAQQPHGSRLTYEAGEAALEEAARQLVAAANAYVPVSHLLWGLWGLIQVAGYSESGSDVWHEGWAMTASITSRADAACRRGFRTCRTSTSWCMLSSGWSNIACFAM